MSLTAESPDRVGRAMAALGAGLVTGLVSAVLAAGNSGLLARDELAPHVGAMMAVTLVAAGILPIVASPARSPRRRRCRSSRWPG